MTYDLWLLNPCGRNTVQWSAAYISSCLRIPWCHGGSWTWSWWKYLHHGKWQTGQGRAFLFVSLLNIYQHTTKWNPWNPSKNKCAILYIKILEYVGPSPPSMFPQVLPGQLIQGSKLRGFLRAKNCTLQSVGKVGRTGRQCGPCHPSPTSMARA